MQVKKLPFEELNRLRDWVHQYQDLMGKFTDREIKQFIFYFTGIEPTVIYQELPTDKRIIIESFIVYPEILGMVMAFMPNDITLYIIEPSTQEVILQ